MTGWSAGPDGVTLAIRVTPRAAKDAISAGEERLAVRLRAPPVDGAANAALVVFLSGYFGVPKRAVTIVSGDTARLKRVHVAGDPHHLASLLTAL